MSEIEEASELLSSFILSPAQSLMDISWLSEEAPKVTERASEHTLYVPQWMTAEDAAHHESHTIKIKASGTFHSFPVEKHPITQKDVRRIERLARVHPPCLPFFLWDKEGAWKKLAEANVKAAQTVHAESTRAETVQVENMHVIEEELTRIAFVHRVSFVHICPDSADRMLASLSRALSGAARKEEAPVLKLARKKSSTPAQLLHDFLVAAGASKEEVEAVCVECGTLAGIYSVLQTGGLTGIGKSMRKKLLFLLGLA